MGVRTIRAYTEGIAMSLDYEPEFELIISEDGDDRTATPFGELYADHATLLDYDFRVIELTRRDDTFTWWEVVGSDAQLTDDDEVALSGFRDLSDAIEAAKEWYLARLDS